MTTITFTQKEADTFRAEKFDPFFRSDAKVDHWRKTHSIENLTSYTRRQLFWLLDHGQLAGSKLEIIPDPVPEPAPVEPAPAPQPEEAFGKE